MASTGLGFVGLTVLVASAYRLPRTLKAEDRSKHGTRGGRPS
ncbi:MAG: hypothetical protein ACI9CA_001514 [Natronomonas sp.]|jgi:hypothetical protein